MSTTADQTAARTAHIQDILTLAVGRGSLGYLPPLAELDVILVDTARDHLGDDSHHLQLHGVHLLPATAFWAALMGHDTSPGRTVTRSGLMWSRDRLAHLLDLWMVQAGRAAVGTEDRALFADVVAYGWEHATALDYLMQHAPGAGYALPELGGALHTAVARSVGLRAGDVFQDDAALYVVTGPGTGVRLPAPQLSEHPTAWDLSGGTGLTPVRASPAGVAEILASQVRITLPARELQLIAQAVAAVAERGVREQAAD